MTTAFADSINPAAGAHPITSLPEELDAARRASNVSIARWPYFLERYGERGRNFGHSDGAWLAVLCRGDQETLTSQVLWLSGVLASRGMPRMLLEMHIRVVHDELVRARPRDRELYAMLLNAADHLRDLRLARISQADADELGAAFEEDADELDVRRLPGMGRILAAAVADEADGLANAVRSVESWAADPAIFPASWRQAVARTLADARARVRPR